MLRTTAALLKTEALSICPKRTMFAMLNTIFNQPDENRIKEVGPDRSCAEWLLRCGAHFRWKNFNTFHTDYNSLPKDLGSQYVIEEVDAKDAAVMDIGFRHFRGCKHVRKIRFYQCIYLNNGALVELPALKDSLEVLEITGCGNVTENGLYPLAELSLLKQLIIHDLPEVRNKEKVYDTLKAALPECDIQYIDLQEKKKSGK